MTQIEKYAQTYRLRVKLDECGDQIIEGRRGHLYFDGSQLCLMALDALVSGLPDTALQALGGKLWIGSRWLDEKHRNHRDVKIQGIPEANWKRAYKLMRCMPGRVLTEQERQIAIERLDRVRPVPGKLPSVEP